MRDDRVTQFLRGPWTFFKESAELGFSHVSALLRPRCVRVSGISANEI